MGEAAAAQLEAVRSDLTNLELPPDEARDLELTLTLTLALTLPPTLNPNLNP